MKIEDFDSVRKLITIRQRLIAALADATALEGAYANNGPDCGGVGEDFEMGYGCHVTMHCDGSGTAIDLTGCYVGEQMADAARGVINTQLAKVEAALENYGVDLPEDQ